MSVKGSLDFQTSKKLCLKAHCRVLVYFIATTTMAIYELIEEGRSQACTR